MATKNITPGTLQQTIGGNYATWTNLNELKYNNSGKYASAYTYGKSAPLEHLPNTPSKIILTNFNAEIPENSKITGISISYRHSVTTTMTTAPDIAAPRFTLKNLEEEVSVTGTAPPAALTTYTTDFTLSSPISVDAVNNQNFGVEIAYPTNENEFSGWVNLRAVTITITYTTATYTIKANNTSNTYTETVYEQDIVPITLTVKDDNSVGYDPTVEIRLNSDLGSMFLTANGDGSMIIEPGTYYPTLYWKIPFSTLESTTATATIYVKHGMQGEHSTIVEEPLSGSRVDCDITSTNDPSDSIGQATVPSTSIVTPVTPKNTETIYMPVSDTFTFDIDDLKDINHNIDEFQVYVDTKSFKYKQGTDPYTTVYADETNGRYIASLDTTHNVDFQFTSTGKRTIYIKSVLSDIVYFKYVVNVAPDTLGSISATVLTVPNETLARMGDGYVYTAQAYLQKTITDTTTEFIDCHRNISMLVYNAEIPSGTSDVTGYMIDHAEYISDAPESYNTYEDITVDFPYNDDYPVYLIFTSDYSVNNSLGIGLKYTNPAIIEKIVYDGYEVEGNYPYQINNVISDTNTASITVPLYQQSNSFLLSKPDLPEWYGTGENTAVLGVQLNLDLTTADECALYARLHSPEGRIGTRSIVLTDPTLPDADTTITIGGMNDLFGFDVLDIDNFNSWELELYLDNKYNSKETATVVFNNASLTIYTEEVDDQLVTCSIDGKDLRYFGLYLIDVEIPEGLETETKYLDITGTDAKEAYRQNIDRKTITVELGIDGCNLEDTTNTLRRVARLLINERDSLNRPIPKRVEFSHYPDLYWEYVMTDALSHSISISDYTIKAKLVVPSGTACSKDDTITNNIGTNLSLVKVNPVIITLPTNSELLVTEKHTGQKFTIKNTKLVSTDTVTIDCENRKVTVQHKDNTTEDITASVDYSSDWFSIHGEYEFETTNNIIQTVTFNERW